MSELVKATNVYDNNHVDWLAEWRRAMDALETAPDDSRVEAELSEAAQVLSVQLAATPATSPEGLMAQISWFKEELGGYVLGNASPAHDQIFETLAKGVENIKQ